MSEAAAASTRVRKFLDERARMGSLDRREVASVNTGDPEREAVLLTDDLSLLAAQGVDVVTSATLARWARAYNLVLGRDSEAGFAELPAFQDLILECAGDGPEALIRGVEAELGPRVEALGGWPS